MKIVDKRAGIVVGKDTADAVTLVVVSPDAFKCDENGTPVISWDACTKYTHNVEEEFAHKVPDGCRVAFTVGAAVASATINNMDTRGEVTTVNTPVVGAPLSYLLVTPPIRSGEVFMYVMSV